MPESIFFAKPILLMLRVNIPCVANTVISRTVHTVARVFHVFACGKREREIGRELGRAKLKGQ